MNQNTPRHPSPNQGTRRTSPRKSFLRPLTSSLTAGTGRTVIRGRGEGPHHKKPKGLVRLAPSFFLNRGRLAS